MKYKITTHIEDAFSVWYRRLSFVLPIALLFVAVLYDKLLETTLHGLHVSTQFETVVTWLGSGFVGLVIVFILLTTRDSTGVLAARSFIITSVLVNLIKHLVGRARPYAAHSPWTFVGPSIAGEYTSFPSGHTTTAFAMAVILAWAYPKARVPAYLLAVLVALSRVALGVHWPSDVVAGSVIGTLVSFYCIERSKANARL